MIQIVNSGFLNNKYGVTFYKYPASGYSYESSSFINLTDFNTDIDYPLELGTFTHVKMSEINLVRINYCTFKNESKFDYIGSGIESFNSRLMLDGECASGTPCTTWNYSFFTNLEYGVHATSSLPVNYIDIQHSRFEDNSFGVYLGGENNSKVIFNEFNFPDVDNIQVGLYLDNSTGFSIEENQFQTVAKPGPKAGIGIIAHDCGEDYNVVYRNSFDNVEIGIQAQNSNRGQNQGTGLKFECNDFSTCERDIHVIAETPSSVVYGVSVWQGAPTPDDTKLPAGNIFSDNQIGEPDREFGNLNYNTVQYFHHKENANYDLIPDKNNNVNNQEQDLVDFDPDFSCPSNYLQSSGGGERQMLILETSQNESSADSVSNILSELVDGGNTAVLEQEVYTSMPPDAYNLYQSLITKSPYLSDSVLMAAIEKENVLNNVLIKEVLVANPQSAKSEMVLQSIEEKAQPLSGEMLAEVLLGKYIVAAKEKLEAQRSEYSMRRSSALSKLKQSYLADTNNINFIDSLLIVIADEKDLRERYEKVYFLLENNINDALIALNDIQSSVTLNENQEEEYEKIAEFISFHAGLVQSDSTYPELNETQKEFLFELATLKEYRAGVFARNILIHRNDIEYHPPVLNPEGGLKSTPQNNYDKIKNSFSRIKIYPNPANNYIMGELLIANVSGSTLNFYDSQGKMILTEHIEPRKQSFVVSTKRLATGTYIMNLIHNNEVIDSEKINIVK